MSGKDKTNIIELDEPPKWGLKYPLNHEFTIKTKQMIIPKPNQLVDLIPLTVRYCKYYYKRKLQKKRPFINCFHWISAQRIYGCPIGGIGGGTIGRGFKGEFCRFQLHPGIYEYVTEPGCQFIVNIRNEKNETIFQSVLSTYNKPRKAPSSWEWNLNGSDCEYTALYPRAWTTYDLSKYGIKLVCRQISPVIPHNYKDSCLPCAVFVFTAKNVSSERRTVSITFTWTEILADTNKSLLKTGSYSEENTCGVTLTQKISDRPITFTIAKNRTKSDSIHEGYCLWNSSTESKYVWNCIKNNGILEPYHGNKASLETKENHNKYFLEETLKNDSVGVSTSMCLDPGACNESQFCLAWDMPTVKYEYNTDNKTFKRYYTKYFGEDGAAGPKITTYALNNYKNWEKEITEWQEPILNNSNVPDWLKSALMNELYFVADGGTIWFDVSDDFPDTDPRHDFGVFGYLEGHEYRMYNTYDVHFYASFALAQLWPNLQVVLQYMYRDTISLESKQQRQSLYDGEYVKYKIKDSIPHDLGDPDGIPFTKINAYNIHDVSEWRDLNFKFILQVMRDYRLLQSRPPSKDHIEKDTHINTRSTEQANENNVSNVSVNLSTDQLPNETSKRHVECHETKTLWNAKQYLLDMYPSCVALLRKAYAWDQDGDGLIENGGFPDQTYDTWVMSGPSAYCGGLWVASISVVRAMADILGHEKDEKEFSMLLEKAKTSLADKLWTGSYYLFDTKPSNKNVVMADQLASQWFLRASECADVYPEDNVKKTLQTIFENNVQKFRNGTLGAVNGYVVGGDGRIDTTALQSEEMWTGVTYGLAALMIYEGMHEQAFTTAGNMYKSLTQMGLAFETPEALYENGNHRSIAYMRPLAVWAMYQAIVAVPPKCS